MRLVSAGIIGAVVTLAAFGASAHSLTLFVHEEGGAVKGSAYFTGGNPAKNVGVQVIDAADKTVAEIETDDAGNFIYTGPRPGGALRFVVSTADGHRAESKLESVSSGAPAAEHSPAQTEDNVVNNPFAHPPQAASVERQLGAIQQALDRLENRLWLRDVIGGIGYIFGLAGLWALWKSRSGGARH